MAYVANTLDNLIHQTAFFNLEVGNYIMIVVALIFLYLAIAKEFEPLLLVPIAFGMLLVNIYPDIMAEYGEGGAGGGLLYYFYKLDEWAILPSLIFMGVGAMTDFGPLIANPKHSLVSSLHTSEQSLWDLTTRQRQQFLSSVVQMVLPPSSLQESWDRHHCLDRSPWRHILICPWCRSFSRLS
jgi:hypothetical protein